MKGKKLLLIVVLASTLAAFRPWKTEDRSLRPYPKGCVFRTVMGEEPSDSMYVFKTDERVLLSMERGLEWLARAQNKNGGWGAGSHYRQDVMDPHAVLSDPATTAMAAMALLRSGSTLKSGDYSVQLSKALQYLLLSIENTDEQSLNITTETSTQIQTKLGSNIDAILTSQFLTNLLDYLSDQPQLKDRVTKANEKCIRKIQRAQNEDGSIAGSGWAGVLQSAFATNALEAGQAAGIQVDKKSLERAKAFQKSNVNIETGEVNTDLGAGVVLYAVSGSSRAAAKEARMAREELEDAVRDGKIAKGTPVTAENLRKIGMKDEEAIKLATAYQVFESAKEQAQRDDIMEGFGNNGGEEFLSYLQTGESLLIGRDNSWTHWYDNISGRLLKIQNQDGSWNGHHCITSPAFCTATCLMVLSVNNDADRLIHQQH